MKFANRMNMVQASAIREAGKKISARPGCISFAQGLPDPVLFPSKEMRKLTDVLLTEKPGEALQYGPTKGYEPLLQKLVDVMKARGAVCELKNIQITTGSQQGISFLAMLFLNPGDIVITEEPTYLGALAAFRPFECSFRGVKTDWDGMNMESLEQLLKTTERVKLVYIVPNFSNPCGITMSAAKRKRLVELAMEYDFLIIEDNPYGEIRFEGEHLPDIKSFDAEDRVVYLGSYSKVLCSGLRVGWMCGGAEIIERVEILKQGADLQTNQLAQMQVDEYLNSYDISQQVNRVVQVYRQKRDILVQEIDKHFGDLVSYVKPVGGMFLWLTLPEGIDANQLLDLALEKNVGYVPGGPFYPEGGGENTIRLNFSMVEASEISIGIEKLAEAVREAIARLEK